MGFDKIANRNKDASRHCKREPRWINWPNRSPASDILRRRAVKSVLPESLRNNRCPLHPNRTRAGRVCAPHQARSTIAPRLARDLAGLLREIAKAKRRFGLPDETAIVSCYEAGRDGFWRHRRPTLFDEMQAGKNCWIVWRSPDGVETGPMPRSSWK